MKNRKAKHIRFHDAIQIGGSVLSSIDAVKHAGNLGPEGLELWPMGVHFSYKGPQTPAVEMFIPFTNTPYVELLPEK